MKPPIGPTVEAAVTKVELDVEIPEDKIELDPSIRLQRVQMP